MRQSPKNILVYPSMLLAIFMVLWTHPAISSDFKTGQAAYENKDFATALKIWTPLANSGDAAAQLAISNMYTNAQGVPKDNVMAAKWLKLSAEKGNAEAQQELAFRYNIGMGLPKNLKMSLKWYKLAAEQGNPSAQFELGLAYLGGEYLEKDEKVGFKWFLQAAHQGHMESQFVVGTFYKAGKGVLQDYEAALNWLTQAAELGSLNAQMALFKMYDQGQGVLQDYQASIHWLTEAINNPTGYGRRSHQSKLAQIYYDGRKTTKDLVQAHMWWNLAASSGDEEAMEKRKMAEKEMSFEQVKSAQKQARNWHPDSFREETIIKPAENIPKKASNVQVLDD